MNNVLDLLATNLNRNDDNPNQELADIIINSKRYDLVKELVDNLNNKDKNIQSDCIKVLYEIGERGAAEMIAPYYSQFGVLLKSKNNRLVWGAMIALDMITMLKISEIYDLLPSIMVATDKGSVITIDHSVSILAKLSSTPEYETITFPLLIEQLKRCPAKQLPMYAEKSLISVNQVNKQQFIDLIESRLTEMDKNSQKQRLTKVLKTVLKV